MKVAFGLRAHSGWAALVVIGERAGELVVVDRRRVELADEPWAKAPYHAAERRRPGAAGEDPGEAGQLPAVKLVEKGIESAHRIAAREIGAAVTRERERGHEVTACAVLVGAPMPPWTTEEILAVHFRMHKAEGFLFRDALERAAVKCGLRAVAVPEKTLAGEARKAFGRGAAAKIKAVAALGKGLGPPWGKDQKEAALAALIALAG